MPDKWDQYLATPDTTTSAPDKWDQYAVTPDAAPAATPTAPKSFWQNMKDTMASNIESNSQPIVGVHTPAAALHNFGAAAGRVVTGLPAFAKDVGTAAIHSVKSGQPNELLDVLNPFEQIGAVTDQFKSDYAKDPALAFENLAGTGAGMAATAGALKGVPKVAKMGVSKVSDALPNVSVVGPLRAAGESITGTRPRQVGKILQKQAADINESNVDVRAKNAAATEKTLADRGAVDEANAKKVAEVTAKNTAAQNAKDIEQVLQTSLDKSSQGLEEKYKAAATKATDTNNALWDVVHKKTAGIDTDITPLKNVAQVAMRQADPTTSPIFKSILKGGDVAYDEAGHPIIDGETRVVYDRAGKEMAPTEPPPLEGENGRASFDRLQRWYSFVNSKMYTGSRLEPGTYNALKMTRNALGTAMGKIASEAGAADDLAAARKSHQDLLQTFSDSPNESPTVASKSLQETTPEYVAEQQRQARLEKVAKYDPEIPDLAANITKLREGLKSLPKTEPVPSPEPKPYSEPHATAPLDPTKFGPEDWRNEKQRQILEAAGRIANSSGSIANPIAGMAMSYSFLTGNFEHLGIELAARIVYGIGKQGFANLLGSRPVVEYLSKLTPADVAELGKLPPERLKVIGAQLKPAVDALQAKGVRVHPAILALVSGAGAMGAAKKSATPKTGVAAALTPAYNPSTHEWSAAQWQQQNPGGDVEAAKAQAAAQGFEVK